jgi:hypothetical protein
LWRLSDYKQTLTGSYVEDRDLYPGFWDHDVPTYVALYSKHEDKANAIKEKLAKSGARDG